MIVGQAGSCVGVHRSVYEQRFNNNFLSGVGEFSHRRLTWRIRLLLCPSLDKFGGDDHDECQVVVV